MAPATEREAILGWIASTIICYVAFVWTFNLRLVPIAVADPLVRWGGAALSVFAFAIYARTPGGLRGAPVWAFVLSLALSVPFSDDVQRSAVEVARVVSIFLLFIVVGRMSDTDRYHTLALLFVAFIVILAGSLVGALLRRPEAYMGGLSAEHARFIRLKGVTGHANALAYAAVMAIGGALWRFGLSVRKRRVVPAVVVVVGASIYGLIASDCRTGEIAAILVLAAGLAMPWLERISASAPSRRAFKAVATLAVLAVFLAPVAYGFLHPNLTAWKTDRAGSFRVSTIVSREYLWRQMPASFLDRPLTGTGFFSDRLMEIGYSKARGLYTARHMPYFHSLLVNCLATAGSVGFVAGLWMLLSGVWTSIDRLSEQSAPATSRLTFANVRAAVLILLGAYPFAAVDSALQGGAYETFVMWFVAMAILYVPMRGRLSPASADTVGSIVPAGASPA